jgi:hypothetical protein
MVLLKLIKEGKTKRITFLGFEAESQGLDEDLLLVDNYYFYTHSALKETYDKYEMGYDSKRKAYYI